MPARRERRLADARSRLARVQELGFARAGATSVRLIAGPPDRKPFGARLGAALRDVPDGGLIVLGSGAIPLASLADRRSFVSCAGGRCPLAITNNRFSSDIIAVADVGWLRRLPLDFATDNALPRWLSEQAGVPVADLRSRYRLGVDLDSPLDLILLGRRGEAIDPGPHPDDGGVTDRLDAIRRVLADPAGELVIAGRTSAAALAWLEGSPAAGSGPWSRSAACERRSRWRPSGRSGRPGRSWARSSTATAQPRWEHGWPSWVTPRSSTAGFGSSIGWVPTRSAGRPARIASRRTCSGSGRLPIPGWPS